MEYLQVNSGEAKILSWSDETPALATFDLGDEFAISAFNPATKTAGLARSVDNSTLETFLRSLLSPDVTLIYPMLQVRIVGGNIGMTSQEKLKDIVAVIRKVDEDRNFINVVSADINDKPHPESFRLTWFDGNIGPVD